MKILMIGDQERADVLRTKLPATENFEVDYSDGEEEEDYADYDVIFDVNFDDDNSRIEDYAALRDKLVFVSAVKKSLNESVYEHGVKIKCNLFGFNAIPFFIENNLWEVSLYRKFETPLLTESMAKLGLDFLPIEDRVGLVKARVVFMIINEACYTLQEGTASIEDIDLSMKNGTNYPFGPFEWCDKIGIANVFETLYSLYDDTKDERYKICPLLKTKYLRNETFYKVKKEKSVKTKDEDFDF
jgi:3-hydroxybutyryl-CoA dehydrogenase